MPMHNGEKSASKKQVALLVSLTVLAAGWWGYNLHRESQEAPIRQHIENGRRFIEGGNRAAAEAEWRMALQKDPQNAIALELLADYYLALQNWQSAQDSFGKLAELAPETPRVWSRLAVASAHLNDETTVEKATAQALKRNADDIDALGIQSTLLARAEKWDEQLACLRRLVELQPDNFGVLARYADSLTTQRKFDEARPLLKKLIAANPDFAPAYAMQAEGNLSADASLPQLAQAENDLRKSLSLDAGQEKARVLLAQLYTRLKQWPKSVAQYQELLAKHPDNTNYLNELAEVYLKSGNKNAALALRRRVARISTDREKRDALKSRLSNDPENFGNNLQMGLLLLRSPQPLDADKYIEKAAQLRPADKSAQAALRELETLYQKHLLSGLSALKKGDLKTADHEISRTMLLRPRDARTIQAVQMVTQAAQAAQTGALQPQKP